ncbi:MAG TPA: acyl-CoA dehydrogenase [Alicycliphilus sp.]|nr:acyl-CoA dehydrogenase [Alicycliphilus sp.]
MRISFDTKLEEIKDYCDTSLSKYMRVIDVQDKIPAEIYHDLIRLGLFVHDGPMWEIDGNHEIQRVFSVIKILEVIGGTSPAVAKAVMDQNLGQIGMIRYWGAEKIKAYLGKIHKGEGQAAFLMTEPSSGSDIHKFSTIFTEIPGGYLLSGTKDWITGAENRRYFVVVAKEEDSASNFGLFFVDRNEVDASRIKISDRKQKLGLRGLGEHRVELSEVFIPSDNIVIPPGRGVIKKLMSQYNLKRCGQAAISIGAAMSALRSGYNYLQERYQASGGIPFQNTQFILAEQYSRLDSIRDIAYVAARKTLFEGKSGAAAAIEKMAATEAAADCISKVSQLCGANGLSDKLPLERLYRDIRMFSIAGGASEVLKGNIYANLGSLLHAEHQISAPLPSVATEEVGVVA